jgi:hypothetical protein
MGFPEKMDMPCPVMLWLRQQGHGIFAFFAEKLLTRFEGWF